METKTFNPVSKKYALNNSYFKGNYGGYSQRPVTPYEVLLYYKQHGELPFAYNGDNWLYDCYCEYQKRNGVYHSQFFTPDATAERMAEIALDYFDEEKPVLDACCGFGQLTRALLKEGFEAYGYDFSHEMVELFKEYTKCDAAHTDFQSFNMKYKNIMSNPPYEIPLLTEFLECTYNILEDDGTLILLIPNGFIDKTRPKRTGDILAKYKLLYSEPMTEEFLRTKVHCEIVVLEKR